MKLTNNFLVSMIFSLCWVGFVGSPNQSLATDPEILAGHIVSIAEYGAVADAVWNANGYWTGTDNADAINECAAYCREYGYTMLIPTGRYGVSETIWLTNPDLDSLQQSPMNVIGSAKAGYWGQSTQQSALCVLSSFTAGSNITVTKSNSQTVSEPNIIPVLGIKNCRQTHVQGISILGNNINDYICAVGIGNVSQMISLKNCDFNNLYAGIVFPCFRDSNNGNNVIDGNNDLLVVEQCTFLNKYNIVCGGTQPFSCEYRNNVFLCYESAFTGRLITNYYMQTRGSQKFSSNLFGSRSSDGYDNIVATYFNLGFPGPDLTIDSNHFETGGTKNVGEVVLRCIENGGCSYMSQRIAITNNHFNLNNITTATHNDPLIDTMIGNRMIIQGNSFAIHAPVWIKAKGAVMIGNTFVLYGADYNENIGEDYELSGVAGNVSQGYYSFTRRLGDPNSVQITTKAISLTPGTDFTVDTDRNSFWLTSSGKAKVDNSNELEIELDYTACDSGGILFCNYFASNNWNSNDLILISNKLVGKDINGQLFETNIRHSLGEIAVDE